MARQRWRWHCWQFQTILIPKYLLLYHSSKTITINKGNNSTNSSLRWHLRALFAIILTQMHRYYVKSFLLRVYEIDVKCNKKAVIAASLKGQPCQIQQLITDIDTASATNILTQRGFNSRTDYPKTTDLKR